MLCAFVSRLREVFTHSDDELESPELISAEGHKVRRSRPRVRVSRSSKTRSISTIQLSRRIEQRLCQLYKSGQIRAEKGQLIYSPGAAAERGKLLDQLRAVHRKLGDARVPSGFVYEIHVHRTVYSFCPYIFWLDGLLQATAQWLPRSRGPTAKRDRAVWYLWHFRSKADVQVGTKGSKSLQGWVDCESCGYRHSLRRRPRDERGISYCSRCGGQAHRRVPEQVVLKPIGRITKASLRRRFKLSIRQLDKIISISSPPDSVLAP